MHTNLTGSLSQCLQRQGLAGGGYQLEHTCSLMLEEDKATTTGACVLALAGATPSNCGSRGWFVGREAVMAAPPFAHHLTMLLCFYGALGFFQGYSQLLSSSFLSPQVVSSQT